MSVESQQGAVGISPGAGDTLGVQETLASRLELFCDSSSKVTGKTLAVLEQAVRGKYK